MIKTSYGESLCRDFLKLSFPEKNAIYNYRPIWLKNPQTNRNLELDIYYPDLKLAVEFNGIQHKLLLQKRKDYFKRQECSKLGILLLSVYHPMDLFKCKTLVKNHTGYKFITGRSNQEIFFKMKYYSPKEVNSDWYLKNQEESRVEEEKKALNKSIRRALKLEERRRLKRENKLIK